MKAKRVVLTDGAMGQELVHRAATEPGPMWGAQVLMDEPELVYALHREFIEAGARVVTINAYSVTPERLAYVNAEDQFEHLQQRAIDLARDARDDAGVGDVAIAGCLPPLYGSYQPDTFPGEQEALATYRRVAAAQAADVDLFICETMSSIRECVATAQAVSETGVPFWVAVSVNDNKDGLLRSGEDIADAFNAVREFAPQAMLINCSIPEAVTAAWPALAALPGAVGAYANGFTSVLDLEIGGSVDTLRARTDLGPHEYAEHAMQWVDAGASIVGGCCEISPAHIQHLAKELTQRGFDICSRL